MSFNEFLVVAPPFGIMFACFVLWRKQRNWVTASMAAMQLILVLNVVLISRYVLQLGSLSEDLFGSPLILQQLWFFISRFAAVVFAVAFVVFAVQHMKVAR